MPIALISLLSKLDSLSILFVLILICSHHVSGCCSAHPGLSAIISISVEGELADTTSRPVSALIRDAFIDELQEPFLALGIVKEGTNFDAADQMPTFVLFLLLGNSGRPGVQLKILAHICRLVKETKFVDKVQKIENPLEICQLLENEEEKIG